MPRVEQDKENYISHIDEMDYKYFKMTEHTVPMKESKHYFKEIMGRMIAECKDTFDMVGTYFYDKVRSNWVYRIRTVGGGPLSEFIEVQDLGSFSQIGAHEIEDDVVIFKRTVPLREFVQRGL